MRTQRNFQRRTGSVLVFAAFMMVVMFGLLAFAVDLGYISVVHSQLQASADATALASAGELLRQRVNTDRGVSVGDTSVQTRTIATQYAALNPVAGAAPTLGAEDVVIGRVTDPSDLSASWNFDDPSRYNAVKVCVRGTPGLFFAKVFGVNSAQAEEGATAMFRDNFVGFGSPSSEENPNLQMLPYAMDKQTWDAAYPTDVHGNPVHGTGTDQWTWDKDDAVNPIKPGPDGILEVNLFPQGTGAPGNRGTVDIGNNNNSTADIKRQIVEGISPEDLAVEVNGKAVFVNGELKLDANGELPLNGDTGISAGVKDELASLKGWDSDGKEQTRIIPIFSRVVGPGNNATYTIVGFEGVRIMDVKLTGSMSSKRVIIQKAEIPNVTGAVPAPPGSLPKSHGIYSRVWLVR